MHIALITTSDDVASMNIRANLLSLLSFNDQFVTTIGEHKVSLHLYHEHSVYLESVDEEIGADMLIFCTQHSAKSGIPSLSVHPIGNFNEALLGGQPKKLCPCPAEMMYLGYKGLLKRKEALQLEHDIVYEGTHHGPLVTTPTMFIEIGSTIDYWKDPIAGKVIAETVIEMISTYEKVSLPPSVIGLGGLHTCPSLGKLPLRGQAMLGHICAVYNLQYITVDLLKQMVTCTLPPPSAIVLDWKGLKNNKEHIQRVIAEANLSLEIKRTKDYKSI